MNGTTFYINGQDLIVQDEAIEVEGETLCVLGVQAGDPGYVVLIPGDNPYKARHPLTFITAHTFSAMSSCRT